MTSGIERRVILRGIIGGTFMGLANLVPGISGGTMLLASGVYTKFIEAIAEVTSFKFRKESLVVLASVGFAAVLAILLFAGAVKTLVLDARWVMYSLFIGLTLGGIPILKKLLGRIDPRIWFWVIAGVLLMIGIAMFQSGDVGSSRETTGWMFLFVAGALGASAMILPGISGGYLLLVVGAYIPILQGIDQLKTSLQSADVPGIWHATQSVVIPVALGIVMGVVVVSHVLKWLLQRYERQTYAVLLGLLIGAIFGLWPFQKMVPIEIVTEIKAQQVQVVGTELVYVDTQKPVAIKDIPVKPYFPDAIQFAGSLLVIGFGFGLTVLVAKFGKEEGASSGETAAVLS